MPSGKTVLQRSAVSSSNVTPKRSNATNGLCACSRKAPSDFALRPFELPAGLFSFFASVQFSRAVFPRTNGGQAAMGFSLFLSIASGRNSGTHSRN